MSNDTRQVTPKDISDYIKDRWGDSEEIESIRREMTRTRDVIEAILAQLSTVQLLDIFERINGETTVRENFKVVQLTE